MNSEKFFIPAKIGLLIPLIVGLLMLSEMFLPLQKVSTVVESKHIKESPKTGTTYSIDFVGNNDQFTEEVYNKVQEGDDVSLEVLLFSKEVKTIQLQKGGPVMENDTSEVYFQLGFAVAFVAASIFFLRKKYYTNKNYRYIVVVILFGLVSFIRILSLNF